jgi:4-diphosphocytidyl-2-C-methyl-D-erythritol kinase
MRARAYAKINLGLLVGPERADGKHEIATVLQRVELHDELEIEPANEPGIVVNGFPQDTLVRRALELYGARAGDAASWRVRLEKHIPLAAGLGGGSSDAAAALRSANELASQPLSEDELHELAAEVGADVPSFLSPGAKLATGNGTVLERLTLPYDYTVLLVLPQGQRKESTAAVYDAATPRSEPDFAARRRALREALRRLEIVRELADLPRNDLVGAASASAIAELTALGAFRADLSGAGPTVYGLFESEGEARSADRVLRRTGSTWVTRPVDGP